MDYAHQKLPNAEQRYQYKEHENVMAEALALRSDLCKILYKKVGNLHDTDDIVQTVYLCLHKRLLSREFSLEQPIRRYVLVIANNAYLDFIQRKSCSTIVEELVQSPPDPASGLEENVDYLRKKLTADEFLVLSRIVGFSSLEAKIISLITNAPDSEFRNFKQRLCALAKYYVYNDKVALPPYEAHGIRFNPLRIQFKARDYGKNPLKFFRDNIQVYKGMSRTELSRFDQSLYKALCNAKQIQNAIPSDGRSISTLSLSSEEIEKITSSYQRFNGYARAAARFLNYGDHTILRYWKQAGFEIRKNRGLLEPEKRKIMAAHKRHKGVALHASKELGNSRAVITRVWREAGL